MVLDLGDVLLGFFGLLARHEELFCDIVEAHVHARGVVCAQQSKQAIKPPRRKYPASLLAASAS